MALVDIHNSQLYFPLRTPPYGVFGYSGAASVTRTFATCWLHNDANDDGHMVGHLRWADKGSNKTVNAIHLMCNSVTSPVGTLRVGIQNVLTGVNNKRGDGTFDRSGTIDVSTLAANTKFSVTMSSGTTTYSHGDLISVSSAFDSYTSGSFDIKSLYRSTDTVALPINALNTIGDGGMPNVILEASDGTYGIIEGAGWAANDSNVTFLSGDTYNEYGNRIVMPFKCRVNGLWFRKSIANGTANPLYIGLFGSGGSSIYSRLLDTDEYNQDTDEYRLDRFAIPEQTVDYGDEIYVTLRANSATNATGLELIDIDTVGFGSIMPGGTACYSVKRNGGAGAFTTHLTNAHFTCGVVISALEDGVNAGGGGILVHPGMAGGMRG